MNYIHGPGTILSFFEEKMLPRNVCNDSEDCTRHMPSGGRKRARVEGAYARMARGQQCDATYATYQFGYVSTRESRLESTVWCGVISCA